MKCFMVAKEFRISTKKLNNQYMLTSYGSSGGIHHCSNRQYQSQCGIHTQYLIYIYIYTKHKATK